jgi:hypothetical protein
VPQASHSCECTQPQTFLFCLQSQEFFTAQASLVELKLEDPKNDNAQAPPEDAIGEGVSKLGGRYLAEALQRLLLSRARLDLFRLLLQCLTFLARELGNQRLDERAGVRGHESATRKDG